MLKYFCKIQEMKSMFGKKKILLLLVLPALLSSCISNKQLIMFRGINAETSEKVNKTLKPQPEPRVKINDALIITVSALDPEAVMPYNLPAVSFESPTTDIKPTAQSYQYYTVDAKGDIMFPVLGKLHVVGLTQSEVIEMIQSRLQGQIQNPIVTMRFLNAKVTVLGEVRSPGNYPLNNGGMTLLEALGVAGDLTQYANRSNVLITRENNGKVEFARLDLRSDEVFTSPYFYLQQNDVVLVEPNQARTTSNQSIGLWLSMVGTVSSAATVVVSVMSVTGYFDK